MKQTATEFLIEEMQKRIPQFYAHYVMDMNSLYEQAKAMEKEQIMNAYKADLYPCSDEDAEQYYAETYKNQKS